MNGLVAVLLFAALTVVVALQVLNRPALHLPLIWSEEVARFLFFWIVLLGAALSVRRRRHFVLDVTPRRQAATRVRQFLFSIVPDLCVLAFALFLAVVGFGYVRTGLFRTATNSGINMAIVYAALPVFAALTACYSVLNLLADHRAFRERAAQPPPAAPAE